MNQISSFHVLFVVIVLAVICALIFGRLIKKLKKELTELDDDNQAKNNLLEGYKNKFSKVFDIEDECERIKTQLEADKRELEDKSNEALAKLESEKSDATNRKRVLEEQIKNLRTDYSNKKVTYDGLTKQIAIFSEDIELIELGFYEPKFDFDTSETFKDQIKTCKDRQKALLREKSSRGAIYCPQEWVVGDSRVEGRKMTDRGIRLTARAFNNECDAAIANCTWKNVNKMLERIKKSFTAINKLNETNAIYITASYLEEKLIELQLTYEYHEKKQSEKIEQAEIKAQMREEARIEAEFKKAASEAIKDEKRYQKALDAAKEELSSVSEGMKSQLEAKIVQLQSDLEEAERKHQRAQSMAEQTKQGHVYIISNIGSFGDDAYKIGMTRRLEPMVRGKELGDASVPFIFDVHAIIHTADAPSLEKKLHNRFDNRRLNMANRRKEFFNVELGEIKKAVTEFTDDSVEFIETAVAQDYYETLALRKQQQLKDGKYELSDMEVSEKLPVFAETL